MKRLVAMLLCGVLTFSLAGCGNQGNKDSQTESQPGSQNSESESQPGSQNPGSESQSNGTENNTQPGGDGVQTGNDALSLLNSIWSNFPEDNKFPCFGGNQTEDPIQDAAGKFDVTNTDGLTYTLLIPTDVQANVDDAASLIHMMNANTFTGAVVHVTNGDAAGAAEKIKETVSTNQFVCGFPQKLAVLTAGDYVLYAFGAEELIDSFAKLAKEQVDGATEVYNGSLE